MSPGRITSTKNATVKDTVRLRRKRNRYDRKQFVAEGEDLLEAALASGIRPRQVFVLEEAAESRPRMASVLAEASVADSEIELYTCSRDVMEKLSLLGGSSRIVAVFDFIHRPLPAKAGEVGSMPLLYLAGISDPGNLGTIIRSAAAIGAAGVVLDPQTADPYSPKALRAGMGALFRLPFYPGTDAGGIISFSRRMKRDLICTDSHDGRPAWDVELTGASIIALGSEREGVPAELKDSADDIVRIPLLRHVESINVAMAATAILYEASRQRNASRQ